MGIDMNVTGKLRKLKVIDGFLSSKSYLYKKERIGGVLFYSLRKHPRHFGAYYSMCRIGIGSSLKRGKPGTSFALVLPEHQDLFSDETRTICLQIEHTLVAAGGRGLGAAVEGSVPSLTGAGNYFVRFACGTGPMHNASRVIEYSVPNIVNVMSSTEAPNYHDKVVYVPPAPNLTYLNPSPANRNRAVITTMMSPLKDADRRSTLVKRIGLAGVEIVNVDNVWGDPSEVFSRTAVMLNIHQTNEHHTLEELRILPAIMQGVIVVSEDVPLLESVPYARFFITSSYEKLAETALAVRENYEETWDRLFGGVDFVNFRTELANLMPVVFDALVSDVPISDPVFI
jgi:hypothetical protein